jgi:hypothetical protein
MEALGDTTSLLFTNSNLSWRHESICYQGASWDYESYQPHIAIGTRMDKDALSKVEPWQGAIELGPEIAEEIDPSFSYAEAAE